VAVGHWKLLFLFLLAQTTQLLLALAAQELQAFRELKETTVTILCLVQLHLQQAAVVELT
jgi:hypothetical protein